MKPTKTKPAKPVGKLFANKSKAAKVNTQDTRHGKLDMPNFRPRKK